MGVAAKVAFLRELAAGPGVGLACQRAGISSGAAYYAREVDPWFRRLWDEAVALHADVLERVAYDRAVGGSDLLAIFLLKGMKGEKYRETSTAAIEQKAVINVNLVQVENSTEKLRQGQVVDIQGDIEVAPIDRAND